MALTIQNSQTANVSSITDTKQKTLANTGTSLATGDDVLASSTAVLLGKSLEDDAKTTRALVQNLSYNVNKLTAAAVNLNKLSETLQASIDGIFTAQGKPQATKVILNNAQKATRDQVDMFIKSAKFDNMLLLNGDAQSMKVQVGTNASENTVLNVKNISGGKLFRSSITTALNDAILARARGTGANAYLQLDYNCGVEYYPSANLIEQDFADNVNLIYCALTGQGGRGTLHGQISANQFASLLYGLNAEQKALLDQIAPAASDFLADPANGGVKFVNADIAQLTGMLGDVPSLIELTAILSDDAATDLTTDYGCVLAADVTKNALNTIRIEQASIKNQMLNLENIAQTLSETANNMEKTADSYTSTDYVKASAEYAALLREIKAALFVLQGESALTGTIMQNVQSIVANAS